jgi:uncharacterized OB-fold protein
MPVPGPPSIAPDLLRLDPDGPVLLGGRSRSTGLTHFPRLDTCPYTGSTDIDPIDLPSTGRLWLWTTVTAPPPGYSGPVPYGFGVVELDGGLRVVTRLTEPDPEALHEGQPMRLVAETLGDGTDAVVTWAFGPAEEVRP